MPYAQNEYAEKFGIRNGQFFATYRYKNLWWHLNGVQIGFGDLRDEDIQRIQENLTLTDEFIGYNENHGSDFQQTDLPMVIIASGGAKHRKEIVEEAKNAQPQS